MNLGLRTARNFLPDTSGFSLSYVITGFWFYHQLLRAFLFFLDGPIFGALGLAAQP